jgi:hypothetical protein
VGFPFLGHLYEMSPEIGQPAAQKYQIKALEKSVGKK